MDMKPIHGIYRMITRDSSKAKKKRKEWNDFLYESDIQSRKYEKEGRIFYNLAMFVMIGGLFFAITPYKVGVALFVLTIGYLLKIWQALR